METASTELSSRTRPHEADCWPVEKYFFVMLRFWSKQNLAFIKLIYLYFEVKAQFTRLNKGKVEESIQKRQWVKEHRLWFYKAPCLQLTFLKHQDVIGTTQQTLTPLWGITNQNTLTTRKPLGKDPWISTLCPVKFTEQVISLAPNRLVCIINNSNAHFLDSAQFVLFRWENFRKLFSQ